MIEQITARGKPAAGSLGAYVYGSPGSNGGTGA